MATQQTRRPWGRIAIWSMILALGPVLAADAAVSDRDAQRLEKARQQHQQVLDRAREQYETQVERADKALQRLYEQAIRSYERRDDEDVAEGLREELERLLASGDGEPGEADSAAAERDARRLEKARQQHQQNRERAREQRETQLERANTALERQYEAAIGAYEQRDDAEAVEALREQLKEQLAAADELDSDDQAEDAEPGHERLIRAIGSALVDSTGQQGSTERVLADKDYVLLYFSASWCGFCKEFTPELLRFYSKYAESGNLEVLLVSSDRNESAMYDYMADNRLPIAAIPHDRAEAFRDEFDVSGIPHVIAFDAEGEIVARGQRVVLDTLQQRLASE